MVQTHNFFNFLDSEHKAVIVNHSLGDKLLCAATDELIESYTPQGEGTNLQSGFDVFFQNGFNQLCGCV